MAGRRGVAQPGRVLGSGPRGRQFKSAHPDHLLPPHRPRRASPRRSCAIGETCDRDRSTNTPTTNWPRCTTSQYDGLDDDLAFYEALARRGDWPVAGADGVGSGRVALHLARAGHDCRRARQRAGDARARSRRGSTARLGQRVRLVEGDMRELRSGREVRPDLLRTVLAGAAARRRRTRSRRCDASRGTWRRAACSSCEVRSLTAIDWGAGAVGAAPRVDADGSGDRRARDADAALRDLVADAADDDSTR